MSMFRQEKIWKYHIYEIWKTYDYVGNFRYDLMCNKNFLERSFSFDELKDFALNHEKIFKGGIKK